MTLRKRPKVSQHNKAPYKRITKRKTPVLTEWEAQQPQPEGARAKKSARRQKAGKTETRRPVAGQKEGVRESSPHPESQGR